MSAAFACRKVLAHRHSVTLTSASFWVSFTTSTTSLTSGSNDRSPIFWPYEIAAFRVACLTDSCDTWESTPQGWNRTARGANPGKAYCQTMSTLKGLSRTFKALARMPCAATFALFPLSELLPGDL